MKLILQKDVKNLGKTGDQVKVKKGYARNFLIPKRQALPLNKDRLKAWKHQQTLIEAKKRKAVTKRKLLIEKLSSVKLEFEKESQKDGSLFGSVTAHEISQALEKLYKLSVDKRDISFPSPLKTTGDHSLAISLDSENKIDINIRIRGKITKKADPSEKKADPYKTKKPPATEDPKKETRLEESKSAKEQKADFAKPDGLKKQKAGLFDRDGLKEQKAGFVDRDVLKKQKASPSDRDDLKNKKSPSIKEKPKDKSDGPKEEKRVFSAPSKTRDVKNREAKGTNQATDPKKDLKDQETVEKEKSAHPIKKATNRILGVFRRKKK